MQKVNKTDILIVYFKNRTYYSDYFHLEIQSKVGTSQNILLDVLMELSHVNEETKVIENHRRDNKRVQGSVVHDTTREIRSRENAIIVCKNEACDPQIDPAPLCPSDKATSDTEVRHLLNNTASFSKLKAHKYLLGVL